LALRPGEIAVKRSKTMGCNLDAPDFCDRGGLPGCISRENAA
jgi:hypothetical protein